MLAFSRFDSEKCCLCGGEGTLTAEHKFKASQIRSNFPNSEVLSISNPEWAKPKFIQGPKSGNLKFRKSICANCNNDRTQKADRAFDEFHRINCSDLTSVLERYEHIGETIQPVTSSNELDVFRYFAKLLCCFLAEVDGPRPNAVGAFAASYTDQNPIILGVSRDQALAEIKQRGIGTGWTAHGGLWCLFDDSKTYVEKIGSRLTVGEVRYEYWVQLNWDAKLELLFLHGDFLEKVKASIES